MKTSQSFSFYPADFLLGTALMSAEEVGAYIRLLCFQWQEGSLPNDENLLARLAQTNASIISSVTRKFAKGRDGRLRNSKMEDVRKSLTAYKKSRSENGSKGGRPKKHMVSGCLKDEKHTESLPSPIPSPSPIPPTPATADDIVFPSWFPETAEKAINRCNFPVDPEFVREVWNQAVGRDFTDGAGQEIRRFSNHIAARWSREGPKWQADRKKPVEKSKSGNAFTQL